MSTLNPPDRPTQPPASRPSSSTHKIDKFTGEPDNFVTFWKQFSSIHLNTSLQNVRKFCYLRAYLGGEASSVISGLQVSNDNYDVAIRLLFEKYNYSQDAEYAVLFTKLEGITLNDGSRFEAKRVIDEMEAVLAEMTAIGENMEDPMLRIMYSDRLPECLQRYDGEIDSFAEFRKLVKEKVDVEPFEPIQPKHVDQLPTSGFQTRESVIMPPGIDYQPPVLNSQSLFNDTSILQVYDYSLMQRPNVVAVGDSNFGAIGAGRLHNQLENAYHAYQQPYPPEKPNWEPLHSGMPHIDTPPPSFTENFNHEVKLEPPVKKDCVFCGKHPKSEDCQLIAHIENRMILVTARNLCSRCLRDDHAVEKCQSSEACRNCGKEDHHTALCEETFASQEQCETPAPTTPASSVPPSYASSVKENIAPKTDSFSTLQSLWHQFEATSLTEGKLLDTDQAVQRMESILQQLKGLGEDIDTPDVRERYIDRLPPWITNNKILVQNSFTFSKIRTNVKKHVARLMKHREQQLGFQSSKQSVASVESVEELCVYCNEPHSCVKCDSMSDVKDRYWYLHSGGRCVICLKRHKTEDCADKEKCAFCDKDNHHSSICFFNYFAKLGNVPIAKKYKKNFKSSSHSTTSTYSDDSVSQTCIFCGTHNNSIDCKKVTSKEKRFEIVKRRGLCFLCLQNHLVHEHPEPRIDCEFCGSMGHHPSLCYRNPSLVADSDAKDSGTPSPIEPRKSDNVEKGYCMFCHKHEYSSDCTEVTDLNERKEIIESLGRCGNCLRKHTGKCNIVKPCRFCKLTGHHGTLCAKNPVVTKGATKKVLKENNAPDNKGDEAINHAQYRQYGNWQFDSDDEE